MYIKRFEDITKEDVKTAGGKGANLGEMTRAGIQVPPGGVLTVPAYEQFMKQNQIAVTGEPAAIRRAILDGELPEDVKAEVTAFYRSMGGKCAHSGTFFGDGGGSCGCQFRRAAGDLPEYPRGRKTSRQH